jgi:hypothetical protein
MYMGIWMKELDERQLPLDAGRCCAHLVHNDAVLDGGLEGQRLDGGVTVQLNVLPRPVEEMQEPAARIERMSFWPTDDT